MLETPHVIVGATIATKVVHPALAIPLSFLSHFALERVPHWNPHLNSEKKKFGKVTMRSTRIVAADIILALTFGSYIAWRALPNTTLALTILASSFFASLPDIIEGPYFFLGIESKFIKKWVAFQKSLQVDTVVIPGLLTQIITIIAAFVWLFN